MAKPIFIVELPDYITKEDFDKIQFNLETKLTDYHVLVTGTDVEQINYKVFYEKDFTEINYSELKNIITITKKI
jgi:hypothetical protein